MKLGEALTIRAKQAQALNDLIGRIKASAIVQDGSSPAENVQVLLENYVALSERQGQIVTLIAKTNAALIVEDGKTMLDLLQEREAWTRKRNLYSIVARAATTTSDMYRYSRSEIRMIPQIDVQTMRDFEENANRMIAAIDIRIQQINWTTEIV